MFPSSRVSFAEMRTNTKPENGDSRELEESVSDLALATDLSAGHTANAGQSSSAEEVHQSYLRRFWSRTYTILSSRRLFTEVEFLSAVRFDEIERLTGYMERPIRESLVRHGLRLSFFLEKLIPFQIIASKAPCDPKMMTELFILEIERGNSRFLPFLFSTTPMSMPAVENAFQRAVVHRNFMAIQFLSDFIRDKKFIADEMERAVEGGDFSIAVLLFSLFPEEQCTARAFLRACDLQNTDMLSQFIALGVAPHLIGEAFLEAVSDRKEHLIRFLKRYAIETSYVDLALELVTVEGNLGYLDILLHCSPSRAGILRSFYSAALIGEQPILLELLQEFMFSQDEILHAISRATENGHHAIITTLQQLLEMINSELGWAGAEAESWCVDRSKIATLPERYLLIWSQSPLKPTQILFVNEDGYGDGLAKQFYSELSQALFRCYFDSEGLPCKAESEEGFYRNLGALVSFMIDRGFKSGKIFSAKWLELLQVLHQYGGSIRNCFLEIYRKIIDNTRWKRDLIYFFLKKPNSQNRTNLLKTFGSEIKFLDFEDLSVDVQIRLAREYLIENFGEKCLIDYINFLGIKFDEGSLHEGIAKEVAETIYMQTIGTTADLFRFCLEVKREVCKTTLDIVVRSKNFLQGSSPLLRSAIRDGSLEIIEGDPIRAIHELSFDYEGHDRGVIEKIRIIKEVLKQKNEEGDTEWLKKFLFFVTGEGGLSLDKPIKILEIPEESYPMAQTCFLILKLSVGYDKSPSQFRTWQERFKHKLNEAVNVEGYQLEPR
jgi:hypothetical protein